MDESKNRRYGILLSELSIIFLCLYIIIGVIFAFIDLINTTIIMWIEAGMIFGALICSIISVIILRTLMETDNEIALAKIFGKISFIISLGIIVWGIIYSMII